MTQALINSLNIIKENNVNLTNNKSKSLGMDFGKIFESKSDAYEKKDNVIKSKNDICDNKTDNLNKQTDKINNYENNKIKESDTKNTQTNITNNENSKEIKDKDTTEENNKQNILIGTVQMSDRDNDSNSEKICTDEKIESIMEYEETDDLIITGDESEYSQETTITEEDPTMYNELITLEDPTVLLMLQSQIQKPLNNQSEQTDVTDSNVNAHSSTTGKSLTDTEASKNTDVFKQLDAQVKKGTDVINKSPVEITRSKTENHKSSNVLNENIVKELKVEVVTTQSAESEGSMEEFMQNQSPQEQTTRIMIQGDIKYETIASEVSKNTSQAKTTTVTPGRIIEQISKQLEGMYNNSKLNMVLNPGTLGKLNLQLVNTKDGIMAQFTVTSQETRDILMKGLNGLKETLLAQGVNVDNVSVKLENTESDSETDYTEQEGSRGGYKRQGEKRQKEDGKNFEEMMFNLENENNV